jgi:outer membrane receptor for ferrienterochelin and colicin
MPGVNVLSIGLGFTQITPEIEAEGVVNKDIHSKLRWEFAPMQALEFEAGYSRQGNRSMSRHKFAGRDG